MERIQANIDEQTRILSEQRAYAPLEVSEEPLRRSQRIPGVHYRSGEPLPLSSTTAHRPNNGSFSIPRDARGGVLVSESASRDAPPAWLTAGSEARGLKAFNSRPQEGKRS